MENILLTETEFSPYVNFDFNLKKMEIKGRSIPENAFMFFNPLINWVNQFYISGLYDTKNQVSHIDISCDYFNSASSKMFLYLFEALAKHQAAGNQIKINWHISDEDEEIAESVEDLRLISEVNISIMRNN